MALTGGIGHVRCFVYDENEISIESMEHYDPADLSVDMGATTEIYDAIEQRLNKGYTVSLTCTKMLRFAAGERIELAHAPASASHIATMYAFIRENVYHVLTPDMPSMSHVNDETWTIVAMYTVHTVAEDRRIKSRNVGQQFACVVDDVPYIATVTSQHAQAPELELMEWDYGLQHLVIHTTLPDGTTKFFGKAALIMNDDEPDVLRLSGVYCVGASLRSVGDLIVRTLAEMFATRIERTLL